jgi:hypothetical protein
LSILAMTALALGGCAVAHVGRPVAADHGGDDLGEQLDFWHTLATKPVTCNDDGFHGLILDLDGTDSSQNYGQRVAYLRSRGLLDDSFDQPGDDGLQRGVLAVMLCKAAKIKGGLTMMVFGPTQRYATRELWYMGLYPPSSPNQGLSGMEFVGIIGKFEDHMRGNTALLPASVMPPASPAPGK